MDTPYTKMAWKQYYRRLASNKRIAKGVWERRDNVAVNMNELEQKMANILDELGEKYSAQYGVCPISYSAKCRSKYDNCRFRYNSNDPSDDNLSGCEDEDYAQDTECEWLIELKTAPLYVLDFAVFIGNWKICVECDGFYFHHADKFQEEKDAIRNQWLKENGWIVKRFTGVFITSH